MKLSKILSAELWAIKLAIDYSQMNPTPACTRFSDFLAALNSIRNIQNKQPHPISAEIMKKLPSLSTSVSFVWIPGHQGIPGNDLADHVAKEALQTRPIPPLTMPLINLKTAVYQLTQEEFTRKWSNTPTTNQLRCILQHPAQPIWSQLRSRRSQVVLSRIQIGHTRLTHSYLLSQKSPPFGDTCNIRLTVTHVLFEYCKFTSIRAKFHFPLDTSSLTDPCQTESILSFLTHTRLIQEI